ncbi:uncharacterized protein MKK02DRAFT_17363 [Dioszegia hungarica]|uniref:Steroid 5-alpha reductase C-terminal domain-containing protein n=1 Tax=Dioszegia hungarica TaxID=4972 RepID=A0AA38LSX0_9TREE|nr:uncharacterized protein MKK02DRAFT_17363 [Dioszegia hungarica]KAI9633898.1 hypothetical protein MKK02DRAFT_17363 [Dioszegia hungarica]
MLKAAQPLLPHLHRLPTPLLTLPPTLLLHLGSTTSPSPLSLLRDPLAHPLHLPLIALGICIPVTYLLGHLTNKVSWVDKPWPFYPPFFASLLFAWVALNPQAGVYGHNLPRLVLMFTMQMVWCIRLSSHALRRGFFELHEEDYRYTVVRRLAPWPVWAAIHLFAVAIFQPALLLALTLPMHAVLVLPPAELSSGPLNLSIPFSWVKPLLPSSFHSAADSTPVLNAGDLFVTLFALAMVYLEYRADNDHFAFQQAKHDAPKSVKVIKPRHTNPPNYPPAGEYPESHHPGFITSGMWRWSRHPNFAGEQLFWVSQALFVAVAAETSKVTRSRWVGGDVWGPPLALSLLFCGSTLLTEWITQQKYPLYKEYKNLVGQFLPQETVLVYLWGTIRGTRKASNEKIYKPLKAAGAEYGSTGTTAPRS